ncbi:hypothetical protein GVN18_29175 [Pseudomonas sp. ODNR1LW]|nr:hypothetical protein [Pseudomonas sp. ODNR1LW]
MDQKFESVVVTFIISKVGYIGMARVYINRRDIIFTGACAPLIFATAQPVGSSTIRTKTSTECLLDFKSDRFFRNGLNAGRITDFTKLSLEAPGGPALTPGGRLAAFPIGSARRDPLAGLLLEPASRNLCANFNAAPTLTDGWTPTPPQVAGGEFKVVEALLDLQAARNPETGDYLFRDLLEQGLMSGTVFEAYNPGPSVQVFTADGAASGTERHSISCWVRCLSGSGDLRLAGSSAGVAFDQPHWARVERTNLSVSDKARGLTIALQPGARVQWILNQLEPYPVATSPIIVAGAPADRAADVLTIDNPELFGQAFTIIADAWMGRADGVARCWMTLSGDGEEISVTRTADNALALSGQGTDHDAGVVPRIPRVTGPGGARVGLQVNSQGRVLSVAGANAHDAFNTLPTGLSKLTLGSHSDGSQPLCGWFRSLEIRGAMTPLALQVATAPPDDAMPHDIFRYVDPRGSDSADGLSPDTAWATLGKVAASTLPAGVHILLRRGGIWSETLSPPSAWCTIGAYGEGARPVVGVGQEYGCDENGKPGFRVEGIHFQGWLMRGWNNFGFDSHMISDCEIGPMASGQPETGRAGVTSRNFRNFYIGQSHIHDVIGDGVFLQNCDGGTILSEGNTFSPADGSDADSFQVSQGGGSRVHMQGDTYDQRGANGGKGNVVLAECGSAVIEDFTAYGLNFGLGLNCDNVIVRRGRISGSRKNPYSWGVGAGEAGIIRNHLYEDLEISDCNRGVSISGIGGGVQSGPVRTDIVLNRVKVRECTIGLFVDRPTSGDLSGVTFENCDVDVDVRTTTIPKGGEYQDISLPTG